MYETPDVVEENTSDYYEDPETEVIERLHISSEDSYNKFKKKYLTGGNAVDYSDKSGLNRYDVRAGCWELAAYGEKETPVEKYRRIKCEMDELMQEIVDLNTKMEISKEDKHSYEAVSVVVNNAKKVLGSLRLEKVLGTETGASTSEGEVKRLLNQMEDFQRKNNNESVVTKNPLAIDSAEQLEQTKRFAELESRLHKIETLIGSSHQAEKLSRLASTMDTNGTLIDSVQNISTKAALLQPSQLDQIETRIGALATKLNTINDKCTSLGRNTESDDKIQELYAIAKKTEPLAKILPNILQRMQTLEQLHNYGKMRYTFSYQIVLLFHLFIKCPNFFLCIFFFFS